MWGGEGGVCVSWKGENDRCETAQDTSPWSTDFSWLLQFRAGQPDNTLLESCTQ